MLLLLGASFFKAATLFAGGGLVDLSVVAVASAFKAESFFGAGGCNDN